MGNGWGLQFPVTGGKRWNEMVIYPQIQENLILTIRMTDSELNDEIMRQNHLHYENQLKNVGIEYNGEIKKGDEGIEALRKLYVPSSLHS